MIFRKNLLNMLNSSSFDSKSGFDNNDAKIEGQMINGEMVRGEFP